MERDMNLPTYNCSSGESAMDCARAMFGPGALVGERWRNGDCAPDDAVGAVSVRAGESFWVVRRTVAPALATSFVTDGAGRYLVQTPADNEWGFVLADDDQSWPGGVGSGMDEWTAVEAADVPAEVANRLGWLLESP